MTLNRLSSELQVLEANERGLDIIAIPLNSNAGLNNSPAARLGAKQHQVSFAYAPHRQKLPFGHMLRIDGRRRFCFWCATLMQ